MNELLNLPKLPKGYRWVIEDITNSSLDNKPMVRLILERKEVKTRLGFSKDYWYIEDSAGVGFQEGGNFINELNSYASEFYQNLNDKLAMQALIASVVGVYYGE